MYLCIYVFTYLLLYVLSGCSNAGHDYVSWSRGSYYSYLRVYRLGLVYVFGSYCSELHVLYNPRDGDMAHDSTNDNMMQSVLPSRQTNGRTTRTKTRTRQKFVAEQEHVRKSWKSRVRHPMLRLSQNVTT